jgi:hypothetical protein
MMPRRLQRRSARVVGPVVRYRIDDPAIARLARLLAVAIGLILGATGLVGSALAHVEIDVGDGQYVMEIGFRDEPAYLGQPNALFLSVERYATGGTEPVDDLAGTLSAEVSKDGQTKSLTLVPMGDGEYEGPFVPTASGDYTFHVSGTIGDATVDESVTSGPTTFNSVESLSAIEFPVVQPDPAQVRASVEDARAVADSARLFALIGIAAGVLGLAVGAVALARSGRAQTSTTESTPVEPTGKLVR